MFSSLPSFSQATGRYQESISSYAESTDGPRGRYIVSGHASCSALCASYLVSSDSRRVRGGSDEAWTGLQLPASPWRSRSACCAVLRGNAFGSSARNRTERARSPRGKHANLARFPVLAICRRTEHLNNGSVLFLKTNRHHNEIQAALLY